MKKIILSTLFLISIFSCKKENAKTNDLQPLQDSGAVSGNPKSSAALKMWNSKETETFLGKKNDTLYITNFFATWCGPCVKEIPHFKNKIQELSGKPVKITFISVDSKDDWTTKVPQFADEQGIRNNTVLLDSELLEGDFYVTNFKKWDGSAIPFTYMRKGDKTDETLGMMSEEELNEKINTLLK